MSCWSNAVTAVRHLLVDEVHTTKFSMLVPLSCTVMVLEIILEHSSSVSFEPPAFKSWGFKRATLHHVTKLIYRHHFAVNALSVLSVSGLQVTEFIKKLLACSVQGKQTLDVLHAQEHVLYDTFLYLPDTITFIHWANISHPTSSQAPTFMIFLKHYVLCLKVHIWDMSEEREPQ
ncbi:uncharacterized protein F5147DRAFT_656212 [Suillus discolor]|uniref:Uncharacterized protein n=1 Tax=Suillus discolor TaxID=1912936 RepID=A0A9P7JQ74_9AGAM|nr:uncharacterized protein F5147DRAFT_656212 [Suillus discolor]KAG2097974.1 hypothetical protein F5147DRAFT_656212 [Suillus discolor]